MGEIKASLSEGKASGNAEGETTALEIVDRGAPLPLAQMDFCVISVTLCAVDHSTHLMLVFLLQGFLWNLSFVHLSYSPVISCQTECKHFCTGFILFKSIQMWKTMCVWQCKMVFSKTSLSHRALALTVRCSGGGV